MAIERERYVIPTLQDIFHNMNGSAVFTSLDAASGYWQMPLDENSSKLTFNVTGSLESRLAFQSRVKFIKEKCHEYCGDLTE